MVGCYIHIYICIGFLECLQTCWSELTWTWKIINLLCFSAPFSILLEHLNGNLKMKQDLEYQRMNNTFAIDKEINFHVNITDRFDQHDSPQYIYFWYNGSELIRRTKHPQFEQNFSQPAVLHLQALTTAEFSMSSLSVPPFQDIQDKIGSFRENLVFKGELYFCLLEKKRKKRVKETTFKPSKILCVWIVSCFPPKWYSACGSALLISIFPTVFKASP